MRHVTPSSSSSRRERRGMICWRAPPPRGPYDPRLPRVEPGLGPGLEADGVVVSDEVDVSPGFLSE